MGGIKDLPPTPALPSLSQVQAQALREEVLGFRLMLAAVIWKVGGSISIKPEDIAYVGLNCRLNLEPDGGGGTLLTVGIPGAPKVEGSHARN